MVDTVQTVTQKLASMALDAYSQRHRLLANNIANIHSDGFQAKRLNFESQLSGLREAVVAGGSDVEIAGLIDQIKPFVDEVPERRVERRILLPAWMTRSHWSSRTLFNMKH